MEKYDVPDEHLSYSELKDRIRAECARNLPKKERILLMATKLKEDLTLKDTICVQICKDLQDVTSVQWVRRCLPKEYKEQKKRTRIAESTSSGNSFPNDDKNVPEQQAMTVETGGYERPIEDIARKDQIEVSEVVETLEKKLADVTRERDSLSNENKILKEKTQPVLFRKMQEKFHDQPGLLDAKQLQKISMQAGRDLETFVQRYNIIIQSAIDKGGPIPIGMYIMTKPDQKLVPVRVTVDFDKRKIEVSLWEKKLECHN